ncbi:hypothetical protein BPAE_0304g00010 [Botrytis paeoniae]|uniref:Uncharacterized protein n=1 Tax=Botrytis paeoniae TaxID=278948 RepID=A0A4Z1F7T9_9HELO|nr:hypothetical protein BPAE_0304g00010 [Botrytis paeoniae]
MPALAGRNGQAPWNLRNENQENEISGPWVSEVADPRSKSKDADFVMKWLTGKDLSVQAVQKVLEIVVVSQAQLLNYLLWKLKGDRNGKWTHCRLQKTIDRLRNSRQEWKKQIVEAANEEQNKTRGKNQEGAGREIGQTKAGVTEDTAKPVIKKSKPVEGKGKGKPVVKKPKRVAKKLEPIEGKVKAKATLEKSEPAKKRK